MNYYVITKDCGVSVKEFEYIQDARLEYAKALDTCESAMLVDTDFNVVDTTAEYLMEHVVG